MLEVHIKKKLDHFTLESSFELKEGCMGILGASGCGKSVTLKCIAGILQPDEGYIRLNGRVLFDTEHKINLRPQLRNIGYLFQNYALFPNMTVYENIAAGVRHKAQSAKAQSAKIQEYLDLFSLTTLRNSYPKYLSGGEQQRTALARLLIGEPQVLLLDEPFSAMDAYLKEELQLELLEIMKRLHVPTILVTHSRDEIYRLSDELIVMSQGIADKKARTRERFRKPETRIAARLTGCKNIADVNLQTECCYIPAWNLSVPKCESVKPVAIGIRAHDFLLMPPSGEEDTCIPLRIQVISVLEAPFEWNVMFKIQDAITGKMSEETVWCKVEKTSVRNMEEIQLQTVLYLKKSGILYLQ